MTNYDKKRKRQSGRQGGGESERQRIYLEGFFAGQSQVIARMTKSGLLPKLDFNLQEVYRNE